MPGALRLLLPLLLPLPPPLLLLLLLPPPPPLLLLLLLLPPPLPPPLLLLLLPRRACLPARAAPAPPGSSHTLSPRPARAAALLLRRNPRFAPPCPALRKLCVTKHPPCCLQSLQDALIKGDITLNLPRQQVGSSLPLVLPLVLQPVGHTGRVSLRLCTPAGVKPRHAAVAWGPVAAHCALPCSPTQVDYCKRLPLTGGAVLAVAASCRLEGEAAAC